MFGKICAFFADIRNLASVNWLMQNLSREIIFENIETVMEMQWNSN